MAKPSPIEPVDRDRLFACSILGLRPRSLFGSDLPRICAMSTEDRWERLWEASDACNDPKATQIFLEVMSEVEAGLVVERIRRASQTSCRSKR